MASTRGQAKKRANASCTAMSAQGEISYCPVRDVVSGKCSHEIGSTRIAFEDHLRSLDLAVEGRR